jgi:cell division transport system ATP-binding protein
MALKLRLFEALNRVGTTVLVATHDVHLPKRPDSRHAADRAGSLIRPAFAPSAAARAACRGRGVTAERRQLRGRTETQLLPLTAVGPDAG